MSDKPTEEKNKLKKNQSSHHNSSSAKRHDTGESHGSICSRHRHRSKEDTGPKQCEKTHSHFSDERKSSDSSHSRSVRSKSSHSKHEHSKYSVDLYGTNRKHRSTFETISEKSVTLDNARQRDVEYKGLSGERRRGDRESVLHKPSKEIKQTCQKIEATPSTCVESVFGENVNRTYKKSSRSLGGNFSTHKSMREDGILNKDKFTVPTTQAVDLPKISSMKFSVPDTNTYLFSDYEGELSICSGISQLSGKDRQMKFSRSPVGEFSRSFEVPVVKKNKEIHMSQNPQYIGLALLEKSKIPDETVQSNIEQKLKDDLASSFRGLLLHIMFLTTITTIAVGMTTVDTFYLTDITQKILYESPPEGPLTVPTNSTSPESTTIFPESSTIIATNSQSSSSPQMSSTQTVTSQSHIPTTQTTLVTEETKTTTTSTEVPTTTEKVSTTEETTMETTTKAPTTTEKVSTTEETTMETTTNVPTTTEKISTTEETTMETTTKAPTTTEKVSTTEETTMETTTKATTTTEKVSTTEETTTTEKTTMQTTMKAPTTTEKVSTTEEATMETTTKAPTTTEKVSTTEEATMETTTNVPTTTKLTSSIAESTVETSIVPLIIPTIPIIALEDEMQSIQDIPNTDIIMGEFNIKSMSRNNSLSSVSDTSLVSDRVSYLINGVNVIGDVDINTTNGVLPEKDGNISTESENVLYTLDISDVVPSVGHGTAGRIFDNLTSFTSARKIVKFATEPIWRQDISSKKFLSGLVHHEGTSMNLSLDKPIGTVTMKRTKSMQSTPLVTSPLFYDSLDRATGTRIDTVKDETPLGGTESVSVDDVTVATKLARDIVTGRKVIPMDYLTGNEPVLPNLTDATFNRTTEQVSARSMTGNLNILKGALHIFPVKNSSGEMLASVSEGFTHTRSTGISSGPSRLPSILDKTTASGLSFSNFSKMRGFTSAGRFTSLYNSDATTTKMSQASVHSSPLFTTKESFQSPSTYYPINFLPVPFLYMSDMPWHNKISESASSSSTGDSMSVKRNTLLSLVSDINPQKGLPKTNNCVPHGDHCVYVDNGDPRNGVNDLRLRSDPVDRVQYLSLSPLASMNQDLEPYFELRDNENISASVEIDRQTDEDTDTKCKCNPEKGLRDSYSVHDFWQFAESTLIHFLYENFWYKHNTPPDHVSDDERKYLFANQIIGVPRMRQVRVKNDSCKIHPDVSRFFDECYYYYSLYSEETRPIREDMSDSITATAWRYTSYKKLESTFYWGKFSIYGGGGYYLDLSMDFNETQNMIRELKEKTWITKSTRAVFIDFTFYNVNVNLFCICKIVLEFPPSGGMIPNADFVSLKLIRYLSTFDFFILGLEFFFVAFVVFLSLEIIHNIKQMKIRFFKTMWSYVDITVLFLSYTYIAYSIARYVIVERFINNLPEVIEEYVEFTHIRNIQMFYNYLIAVLVFFSWVRLLKFITISKTMAHLHDTLRRSAKDLFGFAVMFLILFYAFALVAYLLFGSEVEGFSTFWSSCMSLLQGVIGEFEYKEIEEVNHITAPIFLVVFVFFMFFILMNMFLAIINDAFAAVKSDYDMGDIKKKEQMHNAFMNFIGLCCCGLDKNIERKRKNKRTYDEIKNVLKRSGFSDAEIELFLNKYNIDISQLMNDTENKRIIHDLELEGLDFSQNVYQSDIEQLRRRVDRLGDRVQEMQRNLQPILDKIDLILHRLKV